MTKFCDASPTVNLPFLPVLVNITILSEKDYMNYTYRNQNVGFRNAYLEVVCHKRRYDVGLMKSLCLVWP